MDLGLELFWPFYAALVLVLAAVAAQLAAYRRTTRPVRPALRWLLVALRLAAVGLLLFALWRPAAETSEMIRQRGRLALLIDSSRSMSIADESFAGEVDVMPRIERAALAFSENSDLWREIVESASVEVYSFAGSLRRLPTSAAEIPDVTTFGIEADGDVTALGDAIRQAGAPPVPQALLIVSDGLSNTGISPHDAVGAGTAPIYAISVGSERPDASTRDVAATGIFAPSRAFQGSDMTVMAEFSLTGLAGREVEVSLYADDQRVDTTEIRAQGDRDLVEARFSHVPEETGPLRLEAVAETLPDEIVAANNSAATYVDVQHGGLQILFIEGSFRWEAKFLRQAVETLRDAEVRFMVPLADDEAIEQAIAGDWDILIIGSLSAPRMQGAAEESVREAVGAQGRSVLFLSGPEALGKGGYAASELAPLIPFELDADEVFDSCLWVVEPREAGPHGEIVSLGTEQDPAPWTDVVPLLALNTVGEPRPGASVLLSAEPMVRSEETGALEPCPERREAPVFAVQHYGAGRTAAFTGEGTWQWVMGSGLVDQARREASASVHRRFWRRVIFWLARREERGDMTLDLALNRHRVGVGERVELRGRLIGLDRQPITDARLVAEITSEDFETELSFWVEGTGYRLEFEPPAAGDYDVHVKAFDVGEQDEPIEARTAFVASGADVEFATLLARTSTLASLAAATGGRHEPAENAHLVFRDIAERTGESAYMRLQRRELWSSWLYLVLVVVLLSLEWGIRKIAGLV